MQRASILALIVALPALAAPNFTGAWRLNVAKSSYGSFPAPSSMTRTILHDGDMLRLTTLQKGQQGEVTTDLKYTTDGKEVTNSTATGESKSVAHWSGSQLTIETSRTIQGAEIKTVETWVISPDGKQLTIQTHMKLPQQGEFDVKQVFDKQ
jgi:hypothetical protein